MPRPSIRKRMGGIVYPMVGASFDASLTQYGTIADNAALSMGAGVRMTGCLWFQLHAGGTNRALITKGVSSGAAGSVEYIFRYSSGSTRVGLTVSDGTTLVQREFVAVTPIALGVWYFAAFTYDGTNINISINAGAFESAAFSTDIRDGAAAFRLGADNSALVPFDGVMDAVGIWKRALSMDEINKLYKGGIGMAYRDLSADLKASLIAWYDLDNNLIDKHGGNNLTNTNGVTFTMGKR